MIEINIAIDGPAGAGKSTVAKQVAQRLGLIYIDTGAMYRALTWKALQYGLDLKDASLLTKLAYSSEINLTRSAQGGLQVSIDERDVTEDIRTPQVSEAVSMVATHLGVRARMVELQQKMAGRGGVVMDGRDIGTHVLPNAKFKFFLTASLKERARRRWEELQKTGHHVDLGELEEKIAARDLQDESREIAPLVVAPDAKVVDTEGLTIAQVVEMICTICRN